MGFFIRNLNHNIDQLYNEHFGSRYSGKSFRDYCDQDISKLDFHQMMKTKGGLIYFNNFLSTSKDRNVGLFFAESNVSSPNLISILFVMAINPSKSTTTFASITNVNYFGDAADETLFSIHTIFRTNSTAPMSENPCLFRMELVLTNDDDKAFLVLTERIREKASASSGEWIRLGQLLINMSHFDDTQQLCEGSLYAISIHSACW